MSQSILRELIEAVGVLAGKGLAPATGGNFSARASDESFYITRSGVDKSSLTEADFLTCDLSGNPLVEGSKPSAETLVHAALYTLNPSIGSVLHTHSVPLTVLSMEEDEAITFTGYEMQKSIKGNSTHDSTLELPIVENTQDMKSLHDFLLTEPEAVKGSGFILKGHGLYAWGDNVFEARRHVEGFEFLLECELKRRLLNK